jgi:O-antigen ligase
MKFEIPPEKSVYPKSEKTIKYLLCFLLFLFPLIVNPLAETPEAAFLPMKAIFITLWNIVTLIYLIQIKRYPRFEKSDLLMAFFLVYCLVSTLSNGDLENKLLNPIRADGWLTWFNYGLLYINVSSLSKNIPREFIYKTWPFAVLPAAILILLQGYFGTPGSWAHLTSDGFPGGTFGNRGAFGGYATFLAVPGLIWAAGSGPIGLVGIGFFGWAVGLIQVRAAWVAIVIGFALALVLLRKQNLIRSMGVFILGFAFAFIFPSKQFPDNFSSGDDGRFVLWKTGASAILERPIFGWGVGGLSEAFPRLADWKNDTSVKAFLLPKLDQKIFAAELLEGPPLSKKVTYGNKKIQYTIVEPINIDKAHNEYLDITIAFGLPALFFWLAWLITRVFGFIRSGGSGTVYALSLISLCVFYIFWMNSISFAPVIWFVSGFFRDPNTGSTGGTNSQLLKEKESVYQT